MSTDHDSHSQRGQVSRHPFCQLSLPDRWRFLAMRVRCGLYPSEPRIIDQFFAMGSWLHDSGESTAWEVASRSTEVLVNTAEDLALPWHWRMLCLDRAAQPLAVMRYLADHADDMPHLATEYRRQLLGLMRRMAVVTRQGEA